MRSRNSSRAGSTKGSYEDLQALDNDVVDAHSDTLSDGLNDALTSHTLVEQTHSKVPYVGVLGKNLSKGLHCDFEACDLKVCGYQVIQLR